jgi:MoxR-like ATPase
MMEIRIGYPNPAHEQEIVLRTAGAAPKLPEAVFDGEAFLRLRDLVWAVPIPESVAAFAVRLCGATRPGDERADRYAADYLAWGAGPRGAQNLVLASKAAALLDGRTVPTIDDVRRLAVPVLRHRLVVNHRAVGDGVTADAIVQRLLRSSLEW